MGIRPDEIRILWLSPLPPVRSGVADYAVELLGELGKVARVRVVEPPGWVAPGDWPRDLELVPTDTPANGGEIVVVHLGNNPHHLWLLNRLEASRRPVVVLHDAVLHHLLVEAKTADGDKQSLLNALESAHGDSGAALATAREAGNHGHLDPFLFPARKPFLENARAVVVHSRWAENLVRAENPGIDVCRVGLAVSDPSPTDRASALSTLGLSPGEPVLMHLGFLTPEKGIEEILTGVAAANKAGVPVRLVVVGEGIGLEPLQLAADRLGMGDRLTVTGWIAPEVFPGIPAAADLGVVYRTPSAGETSASTLRFLACGVPVAVGGVRQYLEWPDAATPRITPGPSASADLARLLSEIGGPEWNDRRRAARSAYEASHRPSDVAVEMVAFLTEIGFD